MTKELHPSILHINAKNFSEQTVKMINKMVEKVSILEKIKAIVKKECFEISESTKCSGWDYIPNHPDGSYRNDLAQRYYNKPLYEKTCNELSDLLADLTAENTRLREALIAFNNKLSMYQDKLPEEIKVMLNDMLYPKP